MIGQIVYSYWSKYLRVLTAFIFLMMSAMPARASMVLLPEPGAMLPPSSSFEASRLRAVTIDVKDPLRFEFLIDRGTQELAADRKNGEYAQLVKYFLAALTIPDTDQWVNLSPYEGDRLISEQFGQTEMGRDLLAQDYLLKQLTASLMHPDSVTGKKFWAALYEKAHKAFGTTDIPLETFNKVWIIPDDAEVYEKGSSAFLLTQRLRVMTERDYTALRAGQDSAPVANRPAEDKDNAELTRISSETVRDIIVPVIEKEVNEGQTFAQLRQITSAMILATWYKKALRESFLGQLYADKSKVAGVNQDPKNNEQIYQQYMAAFRKGVFQLIREDYDTYSRELIPRKYFSGGITRRVRPGEEGSIRYDGSPSQFSDGARRAAGDLAQQTMDRAEVALHDAAEASKKAIQGAKEFYADARTGIRLPVLTVNYARDEKGDIWQSRPAGSDMYVRRGKLPDGRVVAAQLPQGGTEEALGSFLEAYRITRQNPAAASLYSEVLGVARNEQGQWEILTEWIEGRDGSVQELFDRQTEGDRKLLVDALAPGMLAEVIDSGLNLGRDTIEMDYLRNVGGKLRFLFPVRTGGWSRNVLSGNLIGLPGSLEGAAAEGLLPVNPDRFGSTVVTGVNGLGATVRRLLGKRTGGTIMILKPGYEASQVFMQRIVRRLLRSEQGKSVLSSDGIASRIRSLAFDLARQQAENLVIDSKGSLAIATHEELNKWLADQKGDKEKALRSFWENYRAPVVRNNIDIDRVVGALIADRAESSVGTPFLTGPNRVQVSRGIPREIAEGYHAFSARFGIDDALGLLVFGVKDLDRKVAVRYRKDFVDQEEVLALKDLFHLAANERVENVHVDHIVLQGNINDVPQEVSQKFRDHPLSYYQEYNEHSIDVLVTFRSGLVGKTAGNWEMLVDLARDQDVAGIEIGGGNSWMRAPYEIPEAYKKNGADWMKEYRAVLAKHVKAMDRDLIGRQVSHGTLRGFVKNVVQGAQDLGKGFGGAGLYLDLEPDQKIAVEYADFAREAAENRIANDPQGFSAGEGARHPVVMTGVIASVDGLRVGSFEVVRDGGLDLDKGRFPALWADDPNLQAAMVDMFDVLDMRNAQKNGLNLKTDRLLVVHASAGSRVVHWNAQRDLVTSRESPVVPDAGEGQPQTDLTRGGIDFNSEALNLRIKRDGSGVPLPLPMQNLEGLDIQGFVPEVLSITPVAAGPFFSDIK